MATMHMSRPYSVMGFSSPGQEYVDGDVKLGQDTLTPGFKKHLEDFYQKASPEDRARCLELITSLEIGEKVKEQAKYLPPTEPGYPQYRQRDRPRRPKTAMASLDRPRDPLNPYMTSYEREYTAMPAPPANAERPKTSRHQASHDLSGPVGYTTYESEYGGMKPASVHQRIDSSSGNRRNNPHPSEAFMIWKLPKKTLTQPREHSELTDDDFDRVMRGKLATTYQKDYLGIPQGFQVNNAFDDREDWKARVPYTLDSSTRYSFQKPDLKPEFMGNKVRYGCNKKKLLAAQGVVPTVSSRHMNIKARTTYEREYNYPNGPGASDVRDIGRQLGAQSLQKYLPGASHQDNEVLKKMIHTLNPQPPNYRAPCKVSSAASSSSYRSRPVVPPATCLESPTNSATIY